MAENFIKKWDGLFLEDWGSVVSPEYKKFQNAMVRELRRIAKSIGAEISTSHKGHYDLSAFFKRGDHYVYFSYSTSVTHPRSMVVLSSRSFCGPVLIRTAADDNDYRGGSNNFCSFSELGQRVDYLLNNNHKPSF